VKLLIDEKSSGPPLFENLYERRDTKTPLSPQIDQTGHLTRCNSRFVQFPGKGKIFAVLSVLHFSGER
jgi:hypothetical protein